MSRLVHYAWIHRAGLIDRKGFVVSCLEHMLVIDCVRLWRGKRGYRKTCRMLRRAGRRVHQ